MFAQVVCRSGTTILPPLDSVPIRLGFRRRRLLYAPDHEHMMNIIRALFAHRKAPQQSSGLPPRDYIGGLVFQAARAHSTEILLSYSCNYSGYVREAAIGRCVALGRPELLPLIVERLNDWVPQVRTSARAGILTLMPFIDAEQLLAIAPRVLELVRQGRDHYAEWLRQFETALIEYAGVDALLAAAAGVNIKIARASVHVMLAHEVVEVRRLVDLLLLRSDDIVLANQAMTLIGQLPIDEGELRYQKAVCSHFGSVRASALQVLLGGDQVSSDANALALTALVDTQSSVRFLAMQYMKTHDFDVRAHYRRLLGDTTNSAKHIRIRLTALASFRHQDDLALIQSFVHHDLTLVRTTALAAWFKVEESAKDLIAATAIKDAAPRVIKLALELIRHRGAYIALQAIQARLMEKKHVPLLMEFVQYEKWNHLECIARLSLACDVDEAISLGLDQQLLRWCDWSKGGRFERTQQEQFAFLSSAPAVQAMQGLLPKNYDMRAYLRQELMQK